MKAFTLLALVVSLSVNIYTSVTLQTVTKERTAAIARAEKAEADAEDALSVLSTMSNSVAKRQRSESGY